jgi:hypothetical protein
MTGYVEVLVLFAVLYWFLYPRYVVTFGESLGLEVVSVFRRTCSQHLQGELRILPDIYIWAGLSVEVNVGWGLERATTLTLKMTTVVYAKRGDYFDTRRC